jgi:YesN/AraC family two-component response regulator
MKVLIVEDNKIALMGIKKVLSEHPNIEISTAENGMIALEFLTVNPSELPHFILLDLNMPIMNGWEFLDIYSALGYHEIFKDAKFIVLSSTIDPQDVNKTKNYSVVIDFLSKPITKEMLENLKDKLS